MRKRIEKDSLESQKLLVPVTVELNPAEMEKISIHSNILKRLGIETSAFGPRTVAVHSFPVILSRVSPEEFIKEFLDMLDTDIAADTSGLFTEMLNMAACKAAIKAGQKLKEQEIEQLISDKEVTEFSSRCPHGRPTVIRFTLSELEKQFKRT